MQNNELIGKKYVELIEACREARFQAERAILRHYSINIHQRFAGEYPYSDKETGAPKLNFHWGFSDKEVRDSILQDFRKEAALQSWANCLNVQSDEVDPSSPWPYGMSVTVMGSSIRSTLDAYMKMAECFEAVAKKYPKQEGVYWDEFVASYQVKDEMRFKSAAKSQIEKMDMLRKFFPGTELLVVGSHRSKSIDLPVVRLECPRNMTAITFRDNFHDICVSVEARFPIKDESGFKRIFNTVSREGGFFEGFSTGAVYGGYEQNPKQFSFWVRDYASFLIVLGEIIRQDERTDLSRAQKLKQTPPPNP